MVARFDDALCDFLPIFCFADKFGQCGYFLLNIDVKKPRLTGLFKRLKLKAKNYLDSANAFSAGRPASNTPVTALIADSSSWPAGIGGLSLYTR